MEKTLKPREVADLLRVSYETVLDWIRDGQLPAAQLPSGHYRIDEYDVDKALTPVGKPHKKKLPATPKKVAVWRKIRPAPANRCAEFSGTQHTRMFDKGGER